MKSITIKDSLTGAKLLKVFHNKKGYFVEARNDVQPFTCLIVTNDGEKITVPIHRPANRVT